MRLYFPPDLRRISLPRAWAPMVRINLKPYHIEIKAKDSPTVNLLIVTALPGGKNDVGFRQQPNMKIIVSQKLNQIHHYLCRTPRFFINRE